MNAKRFVSALVLSFVASGCYAAIPFTNMTESRFECQDKLEHALKFLASKNFALIIEVRLMAVNEVVCVKDIAEESMANAAVVVVGSLKDFSEPQKYYGIFHIHFSGIHGGLYGAPESSWYPHTKNEKWRDSWCLDFIRWSYPDEWKKQGCSIYGGLKNGHLIQPR